MTDSLNSGKEVPHLDVDASSWRTEDDVYESLFAALGAPQWHGRNFDALRDSIVTGNINAIEAPFHLAIKELDNAQTPAQDFVRRLVALFGEFKAGGCPVSIEVVDLA